MSEGDDVRGRVQEVFRQVFDEPDLSLRDDLTAADVAGWDSLAHVNLVIALERKLGVRFATAEIARMKEPGQNVGSLLRMVEAKLAKGRSEGHAGGRTTP